jgi:hypothetical protein
MKYEMIFGDERLFDGAGEFTGIDIVTRNVDDGLYRTSRLSDSTPSTIRKNPVVAMRRIIKEPKRWTWEDKKAGVLPEVGAKCRQGHKDEIVVAVTEKFVVTECQDMSVCTTRKDVFMRSYNPIETPEEKAQRVEYEFVKYVMKDMTLPFELACIYERGVRAAYRKMKGGESEC